MITQFQSISQTTDSSIKTNRRFQRNHRTSVSSKSRSNESSTASLSKFYTKNIADGMHGKKKEIEEKIFGNFKESANNNRNESGGLLKRSPSASIAIKRKVEKQSVFVANNEEIERIINQMPLRNDKSDMRIDKLTNILKHSLEAIKQLQRIIFDKNKQIDSLKSDNAGLALQITRQKAENHKKTLKDIKRSIAQEKMNEIRTENENLRLKVKELQTTGQKQIIPYSNTNNTVGSTMAINMDAIASQWDNEKRENLQNGLKDAKTEISRLHSFYSNELRRVIREHEVVVENKNNQYQKLKKKFLKYLKNFNKTLQKNPHQRVRQFKHQEIQSKIDDGLSEKSFGLSISSDDQ